MILVICIVGMLVGGGLVTVCGKVLGSVVDDCYHDLIDDFKGFFHR